jgi:hypothetical protein
LWTSERDTTYFHANLLLIVLGMKSPSPLKFARKSNIICAKQEETETKEPEENLTAAQKLEQLTLATPNSWGYHLYNVSLRVVS